MNSRTRSHGVTAIVAIATVLALTACEGTVNVRADADRSAAGLAPLGRSTVLRDAARARSAAMCTAGSASPVEDPKATYDLETIADADELVGIAPLDPAIEDPQDRNNVATAQILASWPEPTWTEERWDDIGVGEVECDDGNLYLTTVVTDRPSMPASGRYSSHQYPLAQIQEHLGLQYGTAPNHLGQPTDLLLDLYTPPSHGEDRPLIVLAHGGGYRSGDRSNLAGAARDYARRGFVAASIGYRLNPTLPGYSDLEAYLLAASAAIDDGRESIRWLRDNAATYEIDPDRVAMMGTSAGGGIALGVSVIEDETPGGPLGHISPRIQAGVATGATLTLGLDVISFGPEDNPIMMIHYEVDSATTATQADVAATCLAHWTGGGTCDQVILPGEGHGSPLSGSGPWWTPEIGPFLWQHLGLG